MKFRMSVDEYWPFYELEPAGDKPGFEIDKKDARRILRLQKKWKELQEELGTIWKEQR